MKFTAAARIATVLAGTLMFGLTGCATVTAPSAIDTNGATPTSTSAPVNSGAATHVTGSTVDADEAAKLNQARGSSRAVQIADGSWMVTNVNEPLPTAVQDVFNSKAETLVSQSMPGGEFNSLSGDQQSAIFVGIPSTIASATGKHVVTIVRGVGGLNLAAETATTIYVVNTGTSQGKAYASAEEAQAAAQAIIASQSDPEQWAIITSF